MRAPSGAGPAAASHDARLPRRCGPDEAGQICAIVNAAAAAYRGVIPADCWHEPYMPMPALLADIAAGVEFWGLEGGSPETAYQLTAVMGLQRVAGVALIRHAYVLPVMQSRGAGGILLGALRQQAGGPVLVGCWTDAAWAIAFYERHGFSRVAPLQAAASLRRYWTVSDRQIETSTVLALHGAHPDAMLS